MGIKLIIVVLACFGLSEVSGLKCYRCEHVEGFPSDETCKASSKPDDKHLTDCSLLQYTKSGSVGVPVTKGVNDNQPIINLTNFQDIPYFCFKAVFDGNVRPENHPSKVTDRDCFFHIGEEDFVAECNTGTLKEVTEKAKEPIMKTYLETIMDTSFTDTTKTMACICDTDGCNGDTKDFETGGGGDDNGNNSNRIKLLSVWSLLCLILAVKQLF